MISPSEVSAKPLASEKNELGLQTNAPYFLARSVYENQEYVGGICRVLPMKNSPGGPGGKLRWDRANRAMSPTPRMAQKKVSTGRVTGVRVRKGIGSAIVMGVPRRGGARLRGD